MSDFDLARAADLPSIMTDRGVELRQHGAGYSTNYCPSCTPAGRGGSKVSVFMAGSGTWRWKCFACSKAAGSAIDWVAVKDGITAVEAAKRIVGFTRPSVTTAKPQASVAASKKPDIMSEIIRRIMPGVGMTAASAFLAGRGISGDVIQEAFERKLAFSYHNDPGMARHFLLERVGFNLLNEAGMLKQGCSWPAVAFRPIVFPYGKSGAGFRALVAKQDSPKEIRYGRTEPWWWEGSEAAETFLTEGVIDALSVISMGWKGNVMAIPGVTTWKDEWLSVLARRAGKKSPALHIGFDADKAGWLAGERLAETCRATGFDFLIRHPHGGKDWNDVLNSSKPVL